MTLPGPVATPVVFYQHRRDSQVHGGERDDPGGTGTRGQRADEGETRESSTTSAVPVHAGRARRVSRWSPASSANS